MKKRESDISRLTSLSLNLLPEMGGPGYGYDLQPPLGIACLYAYVKEKCSDVSLSCHDFRLTFPKKLNAPKYLAYHVTHQFRFADELPELPEILLLIKNFRENPESPQNLYLDPCNEIFLKHATERMIHVEILKDYYDALANFARREASTLVNDDIVGFTVFQSNVYATVLFSLLLKQQKPNIVIIGGGPQITDSHSTAELLLTLGVLDIAVYGEGENTLVDLIKRYQAGKDLSVSGTKTLSKSQGNIIFNPRKLIANLNDLPCPDFSGFELEKYKYSGLILPLYGSRGCTHRCEFCSDWRLFPRYRYRSPERVIEDMKTLFRKYGTLIFSFADSLLNGSIRWLEEFSDKLIQMKLGFQWTGSFRADLSNNLCKKLKKAGLAAVAVGFESFSDELLAKMRKGRHRSDNVTALDFLIKNDIHVQCNLISDFPGETKQEFENTLETSRKLLVQYGCQQIRLSPRSFELRPFTSISINPEKYNVSVVPWSNEICNLIPKVSNIVPKIPYYFITETPTKTVYRRFQAYQKLTKMIWRLESLTSKPLEYYDENLIKQGILINSKSLKFSRRKKMRFLRRKSNQLDVVLSSREIKSLDPLELFTLDLLNGKLPLSEVLKRCARKFATDFTKVERHVIDLIYELLRYGYIIMSPYCD